MQPGANLEPVPSSGQTMSDVIQDGITVLQLNVEGLTKSKLSLIEHLLQVHKATAILLQENTHHQQLPSEDPRIYLGRTHSE